MKESVGKKMKMLYGYLVTDSLYNGYLLVTMLLPCLIYQGILETKAKKNAKKMLAKYYFGVYIFLVYVWAVFKVTGIGLLADIIRPGIKGGFNWKPFDDLGIGFVLNIVMFLPLGFLVPWFWKKCANVKYVTLLGFCFSLMIECSQIFNGRATDVDDLIANTFGAFLGYVLWMVVRKIVGKKKVNGEVEERKWEPGIYIVLAFTGAFFLYNPYV